MKGTLNAIPLVAAMHSILWMLHVLNFMFYTLSKSVDLYFAELLCCFKVILYLDTSIGA